LLFWPENGFFFSLVLERKFRFSVSLSSGDTNSQKQGEIPDKSPQSRRCYLCLLESDDFELFSGKILAPQFSKTIENHGFKDSRVQNSGNPATVDLNR